MMRRRLLIGLATLALVLLLAMGGFVIWASQAATPMPQAWAALQSDQAVTVADEQWLTFAPVTDAPTQGLIFYPGGKVDPRAYAPAAHGLAQEGFLVVIVPMPLNLAVLAPGRAADVIAAHGEIDDWSIAGHSLGGSMAANFVRKNPAAVDRVIFWAAYPADGDSMATRTELIVGSIYGTLDGLATPEKIDASRPLLPATTEFVPIDGGNHAQFGWYGDQDGDNAATISREEQQAQIIAATLALLRRSIP